MRNFLLYLAGARRDILEQVPSERSRFLALGSAVLVDGVFIGVVAAVAFIQIGVNAALASIYGCLIGLVFLGLDSRLVAPAARGKRVFTATPRVLLALLCGAVFATTIAIGSFRPEIDQQVTVIEQRAEAQFLQLQSTSPLDKEIITLQSESNNLHSIIDTGGATALNPSSDPILVSLDRQLNEAQAAEASAFENFQCQLYGISANGNKCVAGSGPLADAAQHQYDADAIQVNQLRAQIASREEQLQSSNVNAQRARVAEAQEQLPGVDTELEKDNQTLAAENSNFTENNNDNGLLRKLQALGELSDSNSSLRYYTLFLIFLISILLCVPVLLKIVQRSGPYEIVLEAAQRQEALKTQYRMRMAAAEGVLLEEVLDRESLSAGPTPATRPLPAPALSVPWPPAAIDSNVDDSEDSVLRGMQDMRATAYPDARQTAG